MAVNDIDANDTDEESDNKQQVRDSQENAMAHAAELYVLISEGNYLRRQVELGHIYLQNMRDRTQEIKESTRLRNKKLRELRRARLRRGRFKRAQNLRELNVVTGYFSQFWKWVEKEKDDVIKIKDDTTNLVYEFWALVQKS